MKYLLLPLPRQGVQSLNLPRPSQTMQKNAPTEPYPGSPPVETRPDERLDSWKEIAAYLGRDVTTVQRWEKREGMPVHRHLHDKRGSVYALASELDAWRQSRKLHFSEEQQEPAPQAPSVPVAAVPRRRRQLILGLGAVVLGVLVVAYVLARGTTQATPAPPKSHLWQCFRCKT